MATTLGGETGSHEPYGGDPASSFLGFLSLLVHHYNFQGFFLYADFSNEAAKHRDIIEIPRGT